ncbi:MAG TPA: LysM peptidoglycan-binding domain-containing protein [Actinomycetota bacterium]|nr:LysM peptidoglycan-binding domain-containing protein [Actinomycetota bacterium]
MLRYRGRHLKPRPKRRGPVVVATAASLTVAGPAQGGTYLVRRGENLSGIAAKHRTTVARLVRLNRLGDPNLVVAGQRLRVPGRVRTSSIHVVRAGETLSAIAHRYGTTVGSLTRSNRIRDPNLITIGTKLKVPAGSGRSSAPAPAPTSSIAASLDRQARAHGVDPALVKAVAWQESGWQQDVRSSAGAVGVMQVMPATARWVNRFLDGGGHHLRIRSSDDNVHLGVMYLRHLLGTMSSVKRALAGYYSGPGNVGKRLDRGQRRYVRNVIALRGRFR